MLIGVPGKSRNRKQERYNDIHSNTVSKFLYIATLPSEHYSGGRATLCGSDQLQGTLLPTVAEIVQSFLESGHKVGVLFICHFPFVPTLFNMVQKALPDHVDIAFWDNLIPIQYTCDLSFPQSIALGDFTCTQSSMFVTYRRLLQLTPKNSLSIYYTTQPITKNNNILHKRKFILSRSIQSWVD